MLPPRISLIVLLENEMQIAEAIGMLKAIEKQPKEIKQGLYQESKKAATRSKFSRTTETDRKIKCN
jgi:deoxyxylulose-5-phosphate synthase